MKLWTTEGFDKLTYVELAEIANGCGPATCKWCTKFLDKALGLYVFDACVQHDYDYEIGGDKTKKREDDIRFICNLIIIALSKRSLKNFIRVPYLFIYYIVVSLTGNAHFNWTNTNDDKEASAD